MKLYKYTTAEYGLAAIREKRLKVATLSDVNDPNEWIPIMRDDETGQDFHIIPENRGKFKSVWMGRWGFISLSRLYFTAANNTFSRALLTSLLTG